MNSPGSTLRNRCAAAKNGKPKIPSIACNLSVKGLCAGIVIFGLAWTLGGGGAWADPILSGSTDTSTIGGDVLQNASGAIQVNIAAGSGNAQANVSISGGGKMLKPQGHVVSQDVRGVKSAEISTSSVISGSALSNASGHIAINQASGNGNVEANVASIGFGKPIGPSQLGAVFPKQHSFVSGSVPHGTNQVSIAGQALSRTNGLVQVAQVGGSGNRAANTFALRMGQGLNP